MAWAALTVADGQGNVQSIRQGTTNLDFATPRAVQDITSIDLSAMERLLLLADFSLSLSCNFDDGAPTAGTAGPHWVFHTLNGGVSRATTIQIIGSATSNLAISNVLYTDYTVARDNTGKLTAKVVGSLSDGSVPTWS